MRYDERREIYRDCRWCAGKGCLYCKAERDKEYQRQFPDGPKPFVTVSIDTPEGLARARRILGAEAIRRAFSPGGRGVDEIIENAAADEENRTKDEEPE